MSITKNKLISSNYVFLLFKFQLYNNGNLLPSISHYEITDIIFI